MHQLVCSADQFQVVGRNEIVSHLHSSELMGWGRSNFEEPLVRTAIQRHVAKQPSCQPDQMSFKLVGREDDDEGEK